MGGGGIVDAPLALWEWTIGVNLMGVVHGVHTFLPLLLEQDDGENWEQSTVAMRGPIARRYPLNYQMDYGATKLVTPDDGPAYIDTHISEHAQWWTYRAWADYMNADGWPDLTARKATPQDVFKAFAEEAEYAE